MLYSFVSACLLTFLSSLFFASQVLYKNPKSKINLLWSFMGVSVAIWALGLGLMSAAPTRVWATFYLTYIHYLGALMIPAFFLHFVLALLQLDRSMKWLIIISYLSSILLQISSFAGYLAYVEPVSIFKFYTRAGPVYPIFTVLFFLIVIYTNFLLFKYYKHSSGLRRNQIGYLFLSMLIGFVGGSTAFFPVFNIPIFPFGMYFMFLHIPIMSYAIVKHQLMGIDVFLKKGVLFLLVLTFVLIPVFLICFTVLTTLKNPLMQTVVLTLVIIAIGLLIPKLKIRGELKIENILFGNRFDYRKSLRQLQNAFVGKLNLEPLLETIINTLSKALDLREAAIFLKQMDGSFKIAYSVGSKCDSHKTISIPKESSTIHFLEQRKTTVKSAQIESFLVSQKLQQQLDFFNSIHLELILPIRTDSDLVAFLVLGAMHNEFQFSSDDEELFLNLSTEIAIAIENAKAYKLIAELNASLERKVKERTLELENTTEELKKTLYELKSAQTQIIRAGKLAGIGSLAAGIAHEINNALNATINSATNLHTFWTKLKQNETTFEELFPKMERAILIIHRGMERTRSIVEHLMRFSRKNAEGFKPDKIHEGIDSTIELLANELRVRQITVTRDFCDTAEIFCNLSELNQVFFNMILNSIDAIDKNGHIHIKTCTRNGQFFISIKDNGRGIDPKHIDQIFDPFFTTKTVGKGTGLGLSTSYNIVRDHGGQIEVKSKPGAGTEFIINLPTDWERLNRKVV